MSQPANSPAMPSFSRMAILYFAIMSIGMGQTVVFGVIPYIGLALELDQLRLSLPLLGIDYHPRELAITALTSVASLTFVLAARYWGRRSDAVGRKPIILLGLLGYSVGTLIFNGVIEAGLAGMISGWLLYGLLIISRVALVSLMAASMPASSAFVVDVTGLKARVIGMGRLSASNQMGTMVGPALVFFTFISWTAPLYIQSALMALAAWLVWRYLPESLPSDKRTGSATARVVAPLRYLDIRYRRFLLVSLMMYCVMGAVQQTLGFYFYDLLGFEKIEASQQFSLALMMASIAGIAALFLVVQRWQGHPLRLLQIGLPLCVLGYGCLALASEINMLRFGMVLFGFGMGLAAPGCSVSATYTVAPQEQGGLAGLNASVAGMGFVVGPLVGGAVYAQAPQLTYWLASALLVPVCLFALKIKPPAMEIR